MLSMCHHSFLTASLVLFYHYCRITRVLFYNLVYSIFKCLQRCAANCPITKPLPANAYEQLSISCTGTGTRTTLGFSTIENQHHMSKLATESKGEQGLEIGQLYIISAWFWCLCSLKVLISKCILKFYIFVGNAANPITPRFL